MRPGDRSAYRRAMSRSDLTYGAQRAGRAVTGALIRWPAWAYGACAVFAALVAVFAGYEPERIWGRCAAVGYGCAAAAALTLRRRPRAREITLAVALAGAVLVPLAWLAAASLDMPEVGVVQRAAALLIAHGRLYQTSGALAGEHLVYGYDPYLPLMMVFGLPHALFGPALWTDPRVWDAVVFAVSVTVALRVAGTTAILTARPRSFVRWAAVLVAWPVIAYPLAVSGNDLPVLGLVCLGLAFAGPGRPGAAPRPVAAGLALGLAAAMKAIAWPALLVVGIVFAMRDGRRAVARFAWPAAAVLAVTAGPVLATEPVALVQNTIMFPLGLTKTVSTAASPLPGHLLADIGPAGHAVAIALLIAVAMVLAAALALRPPRGVPAAVGYLATALTLMFALAPNSRYGYFVYPLGLGAWLWLTRIPGRRPGRPPERGRPERGRPERGRPGHEPSGHEPSERGHVDHDGFLRRPGDDDHGVGVRRLVLLAVRHVRRYPHVVARSGFQPGQVPGGGVAEDEHRVARHHVDARL